MPSANLMSSMSIRDSYPANGLVRSHQQVPNTSSQTSLPKVPSNSPQYLYSTKPPANHQVNLHFPSAPSIMGPIVPGPTTHMPKTDPSINSMGTVLVPQSQQHSININHTTIVPQTNGLNNSNQSQPTILMPPITMVGNNTSLNSTQQFQRTYQPPQQQNFYQQQQNSQSSMINSAMQQVPMTTLMIPATAATQIQSASVQIQQAAMQAMATNPGQPQILVFMIPYIIGQPPTIPPTPDQTNFHCNLLRSSQQRASFHAPPQNQPPQQFVPSHQSQIMMPTHSRAVSSLSNTKSDHDKFYIKANFFYQPTRNKMELAFQKGDILHVIDTLINSDYGRQYWLATRVSSNGKDIDKGLIPDKKRAEEIALEQRTLNMSDSGCNVDEPSSSSGVLSASVGRVNFLKRRAAQRSKSLCKDNWENVVFDIGSLKLPAYERVLYKHPGFCRPVVIFGALADFAREKLLKDYPEKYSYPSGYNQSPDHPKVIRLKGILEVIDQGKHALLDITPSAVEKLNFVNLAPIVMFMKTESKSIIKEFRSRAAQSLDPNARDEDTLRRDGKSSRKLLEQSVKLEKTWSHVFTVILDLSMMGSEQWYRKLRETIEDQQSANVWMSDKKSDKKSTSSSTANLNEMLVSMPNIQSSSSSTFMENPDNLADRFSESLNMGGKRSIDPLPEGIYGNRSQLRNAYAHSLAQKLARASSEPKLNGIITDNDDDDDDGDDEIIKKPFPNEFENSSSISSSNGATSYGHGSMTGSNLSYRPTISQQHAPQQSQQQQHQPKYDQGSLNRMHEGIYSRSTQITAANGVSYGNDNNVSNQNYHMFPPITSDNGHHSSQSASGNIAPGVIDLQSNHDTRTSAFQVYSDINQNNYHYYNLDKI